MHSPLRGEIGVEEMITRTELLYDADHGTDNEGWYIRLYHDDGQEEDRPLDTTTEAEAREEARGYLDT